MRIAGYLLAEHDGVLSHLRVGMEPAAGVVQVDDALGIEAAVLGRPQIVQRAGSGVSGMAVEESRAGHAPDSIAPSGTVFDSPHVSDGRAGSTFHRHSRTVSIRLDGSMSAT